MSEHNGKHYQPRPGFIRGVVVNFAGNDFVLAPLGLGAVREFDKRGKAIKPDDTDEKISIGVDMIVASLQRNYPEITREEIEPMLDMVSIEEATRAITSQSGMERTTPGELAARKATDTPM